MKQRGRIFKKYLTKQEVNNMKCPNCGKDNPLGSKFCNNCGKKLPEQSLEQIWNEVQESSKKPTSILKDVPECGPAEIRKPESKFKSLLKINKTLVCGIISGAVVLVAVLGICLSTCNCNSTPTQTVNTSETETSESATSEEAKSAYQIHYADLDKKVQFNDIELDVNSSWEYKKMYNNKVVYYINGKSYYLTLFRREISLDDATNFVNATLENKDNKYLSCRKDYVNDVSGVAYSEVDRNDNYIRTSAFYYDKYLYSISLTAAKEYEDDVINGLPSTKNVWLDEITENKGVENTCLLDDLSDKDIEKVLGVFNPNMVDAAKKYFVFTSEKHMEPSFAVCNVVYNDDDPSNIMNDYKIKFSCDYNEDDDDDFAYFCNDFVNIFDLFTEGSGSDFTIVSVDYLM